MRLGAAARAGRRHQPVPLALASVALVMTTVITLGPPDAAGTPRRATTPPFGAQERAQGEAGTASITVIVDAQPNDGQDFGFTGCGPLGCGPFLLDDDATPTRPAQFSSTALDAGTYTVTQAAVTNWSLASIVCDTGESVDLTARRATITLTAAEHTTCTFTDTSAAITVVLDQRPDSGQDVGFTGCGPGGCGPFTLDDDVDAAHPSQVTTAGLAPGSYTINQGPVAGWLLTRLTCSTGEVVDLAARTATVTLTAGEQTTCTFVDETLPDLTVQTVVSGQLIPWDVNWTPDGSMLWTERGGQLNVLPSGGGPREITLNGNGDFYTTNEIGLLGLAVDPAFTQNRRIYTCQGSNVSGVLSIKVIAWTLDAGMTSATRVVDPLVGGIPLSSFHGGCRLEFAPDGSLFVTTGDAGTGTAPQSLSSLGGKTLRVNPATGAGVPTNVFAADGDPNTDARIYTRGHRNVQGLAFRPGGQVWSVEHGPDIDDEVNLLQNGGNYGWNPVPGYNQNVPMTDAAIPGAIPARWSSGAPTLATSGATFLTGPEWEAYRGFLAVATLKDSSLRMMAFDASGAFVLMQTPAALDGTYGRLRTPAIGPDGALYVTTSNGSDDKILRVTPT